MKKVLCIMVIVFAFVGLSSASAAGPSPFQSVLGLPEGDYLDFLPVIVKNASEPSTARIGPVCGENSSRGQTYRDLIAFTSPIFDPINEWASSLCQCGSANAFYQGSLFGHIVGKMARIVMHILGMIWNIITRAIGLILSILAMARGEGVDPQINCENDMQYFCFILAMFASLDNMAGGAVMAVVLFVLAVLSFYLGMYLIREIRKIMEPTSGGET